ncbi:MAG: HD domain-containing protein [Salibacteraceae bacterium]
MKTLKTFNDPVYGFITINDPLLFEIIEHPYFQRLRRISQLGLTNLVYSGANHSRFQHALGAMNLMNSAIGTLRNKGISITPEEERAAKAAILLHDVGHGPFSHALERSLVRGANHESIGLMIMNQLNEEFSGALDMAIEVYRDTYPVRFLHQLVSSQLDTDRMDYLKRDSFFTGVSEGTIGSERIIKMLTVHNDQLAVEAKGIYSLEKFLMARRLMYWQVYLHKTVLSAEFLLMNILQRAQELCTKGEAPFAGKSLAYFLTNQANWKNPDEWLPHFLRLDDSDILSSIKQWTFDSDPVLAEMCQRLVNRRLLKTHLLNTPLSEEQIGELQSLVANHYRWTVEDAAYLLFTRALQTQAYNVENENINVMFKDGTVKTIQQAAGIFRFSNLSAPEQKLYLYFPDLPEIRDLLV